MKQYSNKKVYIYPIQDTDGVLLDLINVLTYVSEQISQKSADQVLSRHEKADAHEKMQLDRVDTFIGRNDRGEYVKVGSTENLSAPGVIFRYSSFVREQEKLMGYYLQCYHKNLHGLVYTENGAYYSAP